MYVQRPRDPSSTPLFADDEARLVGSSQPIPSTPHLKLDEAEPGTAEMLDRILCGALSLGGRVRANFLTQTFQNHSHPLSRKIRLSMLFVYVRLVVILHPPQKRGGLPSGWECRSRRSGLSVSPFPGHQVSLKRRFGLCYRSEEAAEMATLVEYFAHLACSTTPLSEATVNDILKQAWVSNTDHQLTLELMSIMQEKPEDSFDGNSSHRGPAAA